MSIAHTDKIKKICHMILFFLSMIACSPIEGSLVTIEAGMMMMTPTAGVTVPTGGMAEWTPTNDPYPEVSDRLLETTLLLKVFPNTAIDPDVRGPAFVYCSAITIAPTALVVPGDCVRRGVSYGELFAGNLIDFTGTRPRAVSKVTAIFTHPEYERLTGTDVAVISVDPPLTSQVPLFSTLDVAKVSAFVRIGYIQLDPEGYQFQKVSKVIAPNAFFPGEIIFGLGAAESCKVPGGGTVFPIESDQVGVIGMNLRGNENCADSGVTLRFDAVRNFLFANNNRSSIPGGYPGEVRPTLTCGQTLLCGGDVNCQAQIHPDHLVYRDDLFLCAIDHPPCEQNSCYETSCLEELNACFDAPSLSHALPPPVGGQNTDMTGGMTAAMMMDGGAGLQAGASGGGDVAGSAGAEPMGGM